MKPVEPALTPEQWETVRRDRVRVEDIVHPIMFTADMPCVIAVANDALPDSDPRKLRRRHVVALRSVLRQNPDNLPAYGEPLHQLCEALDAILPPARNDWEKGSLYGTPPEGS